MVLIVDYKVVPIGVAYDIQNQVLGSTSQLIKLLDVVGVPSVVHGEVYSTKVHGVPWAVEPTDG